MIPPNPSHTTRNTAPKQGDLYLLSSAAEITNSETYHGRIRVPMRREFPIKLTHGNYNVDTLQTELQSKFDDALNTTKIETFTLNNSSEDLSKNEYVYLRNELKALHTSYSTEEQESSPYRDLDDKFIFDENHTGYIPNYRDITTRVDQVMTTTQEIIVLGNGVFQSAAVGTFFTGAEAGNFVLLRKQEVQTENGVYKILVPPPYLAYRRAVRLLAKTVVENSLLTHPVSVVIDPIRNPRVGPTTTTPQCLQRLLNQMGLTWNTRQTRWDIWLDRP